MDSGLIVRPNASTARMSATRRDGAVRTAIVTDLATSQTVTAAPNAATAQNNTARDTPVGSSDVAKVVLDAQSREVLYRTLDEPSPRAVRQAPAAVARRLKAYARSSDEENANPNDPQADFQV